MVTSKSGFNFNANAQAYSNAAEVFVKANLKALCKELVASNQDRGIGPKTETLNELVAKIGVGSAYVMARSMIQNAAVEKIAKGE